MKSINLELTVNRDGEPAIKFRHHERCDLLEHKLLKIFVDKASKGGLVLRHAGGRLEAGTDNSWEDYEIRTK